ncbi:MAG TPA: C39 family peptidase [Pantanalinema sp.]
MVPRRLLLASLGAILVGCSAPQTLAMAERAPEPGSFFITQYTHPVYHPEPTPLENANCGPTSLAMAITAYGKVPYSYQGSRDKLIDAVRLAMTGQNDIGTWTYPAQFPDAAKRFGLATQMVHGGADGVLRQLAVPGRMVIVNVNPTPAYAEQLAHPFNGGHFALVTGFDGERIHLNDPLAATPVTITRKQLELALTTPLGDGIAPFNGGIAVWASR